MFFIPGQLISLATFPGVILHEVAHRFFADLADVPVYEVKYFQLSWRNTAGYVVHGPTKGVRQALLISVGPLLINSLICSVLTFISLPFLILEKHMVLGFFLGWVGLSAGMNAFPSNQDMSNITQEVKRLHNNKIPTLVARFFALLFMMANLLRFFWFDLIYAVGVALILPTLAGMH